MFEIITFHIDLASGPFGNLKYRDRTVLVLCKENNQYLFGAKNFYPAGIVRMLGGGVDKDEEILEAATREMREEINIEVDQDLLKPLIEVRVVGNYKDRVYKTSIFVCALDINGKEYKAGDDVRDIVKLRPPEVTELISKYQALKPDNLFLDNENTFSWGDYGKVYGFVLSSAMGKI